MTQIARSVYPPAMLRGFGKRGVILGILPEVLLLPNAIMPRLLSKLLRTMSVPIVMIFDQYFHAVFLR